VKTRQTPIREGIFWRQSNNQQNKTAGWVQALSVLQGTRPHNDPHVCHRLCRRPFLPGGSPLTRPETLRILPQIVQLLNQICGKRAVIRSRGLPGIHIFNWAAHLGNRALYGERVSQLLTAFQDSVATFQQFSRVKTLSAVLQTFRPLASILTTCSSIFPCFADFSTLQRLTLCAFQI